ncbi:hypothetical protein L6R29_16540 [Myxococcota bacterium]|nr:hypothetical protein [Myxococcota bacterium]
MSILQTLLRGCRGWGMVLGCCSVFGGFGLSGCVVEPNVIYCDRKPDICPTGTFCWNETFCVDGAGESNGGRSETPPELPAWEEAPPFDAGETSPEFDVGLPETTNCSLGLTNCGGACVDLSNDSTNCGVCFVKCEAKQVCAANVCVP